MSRDYTEIEARNDTTIIRKNANDKYFLRRKMMSLNIIIRNAEICISAQEGFEKIDRYEEITVARNNLILCELLLDMIHTKENFQE